LLAYGYALPLRLQEKFEEAVPEYNSAVELLRSLEGGLAAHRRRAAELDFKRANALQLIDKPGDALSAIRSAKAHLQVGRETCAALHTWGGGLCCLSCGVAWCLVWCLVWCMSEPLAFELVKRRGTPAGGHRGFVLKRNQVMCYAYTRS
jgi:hypothetical protein